MGVEVLLRAFLISPPDESERSISRLGRFNPGERVSGTHGVSKSRGRCGDEKMKPRLPGSRTRSLVVMPTEPIFHELIFPVFWDVLPYSLIDANVS